MTSTAEASGEPGPRELGLVAALVELEVHVAELGFDQPPRLFALVGTDELLAADPGLAERLGLRGSATSGLADQLTAVEQDGFEAAEDLVGALHRIEWPAAVAGCAVSCERTFLPAGTDVELPEDPAAAAELVASHPQAEEVRVVVGVLRDGPGHGVARLRRHPEELLAGADLVPGLGEVLAYTLLPDPAAPGTAGRGWVTTSDEPHDAVPNDQSEAEQPPRRKT